MNKEKKQSILGRLFHYGAGVKGYTIIGMVLSGVSAVCSLLPIIFIWLCIKELFEAYPNFSDSQGAVEYAVWAAVTAISAMLIYGVGLLFTHKAAFRIATNIRVAAMAHLMKLPLGYFSANSSGRLRRTVNDGATRTETFLAHQLPDLVGAYTTPVAILVIIFSVNWTLGIACLVPLIVAFILQGVMMGGGEYKTNLVKYEESLAEMNAEAVEYVRGIPVVKSFGQSIFSFKKFYKSITDYRDFVIRYTLWFRSSMALYQTAIGGATIFLVAGGILLFGGAVDAKAFLLDFIFYIFISPVLAIMMLRIMWTSQDVGSAESAMDGVDTLLAQKTLPKGAGLAFPQSKNIKFSAVSFTYPDATQPAKIGKSNPDGD